MAIKLTKQKRDDYLRKLSNLLVVTPDIGALHARIEAFAAKHLPAKIKAVLDDPNLKNAIEWKLVPAFPADEYAERFHFEVPNIGVVRGGHLPRKSSEWKALEAMHAARQKSLRERKSVLKAVNEVLNSSSTLEEAISKLPALEVLLTDADKKETMSLTETNTTLAKLVAKNATKPVAKPVVTKVKDPKPEVKKPVTKKLEGKVVKALKALKSTKKTK